jgi:hypothetical protein
MIEKPPKYQEKVEMEATYFDIQIKLQQLRQAPYLPPEGIVMAAGHKLRYLKPGFVHVDRILLFRLDRTRLRKARFLQTKSIIILASRL